MTASRKMPRKEPRKGRFDIAPAGPAQSGRRQDQARSATEAGSEMRSYYGRPVIKEPTWTWEIPYYLFSGGLAGASAVLSLYARLAGNEPLAKRALYIGALADVVNPALLVSDLGRPERFLNMLRVFKPTSPMSVGSWVLFVSSGASSTAALLERLERLAALKHAAEGVSAVAGAPLATYTGALLANTAVPVWHEARQELPWIFGASAAASAGAAAALTLHPRDAGPARRLALAGVMAEGTLMQLMERRLGPHRQVYKEGAAGKLSKLAKGMATSGALVLLKGGHRRSGAVLGSALVLGGELALRWSVFKAGFQSARDPRYTVGPQRERVEREGTRATTKPGGRAPLPASQGAGGYGT